MSAVERASHAFEHELTGEPSLLSRAPGRVNLIGEHVDYNDGYVMPVAIDRDVVVIAGPRPDRVLHVLGCDYGQEIRFDIGEKRTRPSGWGAYVRGVVHLLDMAGIPLRGANLAIAGDVPQGAGLSSSAALTVAVANALLAISRVTMPPFQVVQLCRAAELEFAGVSCGIMDPFVSVCGAEDRAVFLDCRSMDYMLVPLPQQVRLIATESGVRRNLNETEYNARVSESRGAARALGVRALRDARMEQLDDDALTDRERRRARHVIEEIARTRTALDALEHGELDRVGQLLDQSHASLRDNFEVSTPEIEELVEIARRIDGVYGARLTGAGFGGCTLSLVHEDAVEDFLAIVPEVYRERTGNRATPHVCRAAPGASVSAWEA